MTSEIRSSEEMRRNIEDIIERMVLSVPDTVMAASVPRFFACSNKERRLELVFDTKPWMRNSGGILHGGMIAMMLDTAMGVLSYCYVEGKGVAPTISMNVSYLRPIPVGVELHVAARALHTGRSLNSITAEAWVESPDKPAATASASFFAAGARRD